ncbi:MAG: hypothetical protein ACFB0Z_04290 [Candidatus Phaeomarinobacter sp.]
MGENYPDQPGIQQRDNRVAARLVAPGYAVAAERTKHEARMGRRAKAAADAGRVMGRRRWQRKYIAVNGPRLISQ